MYYVLSLINDTFICVSNFPGRGSVNREKDDDLFGMIKKVPENFDFNIVINSLLQYILNNEPEPEAFRIENTYNDLKCLMNDYVDF